jgi:hypothetical protein
VDNAVAIVSIEAGQGRDARCREQEWTGNEMRLFLAAVVSLATLGSIYAQERANPPQTGSEAAAVVGQEDLADIMHVTQLRHLKLSYAGSVRNWDLAEYEARQMGKSFRRAAQFYPVFENVPLARLIAEISTPALVEVEKAIKERDGDAFFKSFKRLTAACNSCHQETGRGFIRIRAPTASPFSNQVFPPAKN